MSPTADEREQLDMAEGKRPCGLTDREKRIHREQVKAREDAELALAEWEVYARRLSKTLKERGLPDGTQVTPTGEIVQ